MSILVNASTKVITQVMAGGTVAFHPEHALAAILAAAFQTGPAPPAEVAGLSPVSLFRQICLEGGGTLRSRQVRPISYRQLPGGVRQALGAFAFASSQTIVGPISAPPLRETQVPNRLYRVPDGTAFLIAPATAPIPDDTIGAQCLVLWRGEHWDEIQSALRSWSPIRDGAVASARRAMRPGGVVVFRLDGFEVTIASYRGWMFMRSMPLETPSTVSE